MLNHSELHDDELLRAIAADARTGCVTLWSVAAIFLVPGLADREPVLVMIGIALAGWALLASARCARRPAPPRRRTTKFRPVARHAAPPARRACRGRSDRTVRRHDARPRGCVRSAG